MPLSDEELKAANVFLGDSVATSQPSQTKPNKTNLFSDDEMLLADKALETIEEATPDPRVGVKGQGFGGRPSGRLTPGGIFEAMTTDQTLRDTMQPEFSATESMLNVPSSLYNVGAGAVEAVTSPLQTLGVFKTGAEGAVDIAMGNETVEADVARAMGKEMTRMLRDPVGTLQEDPIGGILDLSAFAKPAMIARLGGVGKAAKFLKYVDPAEVAVVAVSKAGKKGINFLSEFMEAKTGQRSGVGALRINAAREAGREGGAKGDAFKSTINSKKEMSDLVLDYERGIKDGKDIMAQRFKEDTADLSLANPANPVNPVNVRKNISKDLENTWGIKIDPQVNADGSVQINLDFSKTRWKTRPDKQERVRTAYEVMKNWGDASIDGSHLAIQQLDQLIERGINRADWEDVNAVVQGMRQKIRDELGTKIGGYNLRAERYARMKQFLEEAEKALGLEPQRGPLDFIGIEGTVKPIKTKTLTRIGNAMNDRVSDSNAYNRALVEEIDNIVETAALKQQGIDMGKIPEKELLQMAKERGIATDIPIDGSSRSIDQVRGDVKLALLNENGISSNLSTELAAVQLKDLTPRGIQTLAAGGATGGGVGFGAGYGLAQTLGFGDVASIMAGTTGSALGRVLSALTIENPRAVGNFMYRLGATEKLAGDLVKQLDALRDNLTTKHKVTNAALSGMSIAEAVNRAMREEAKRMKKRGRKVGYTADSRYER